MRAAKRSSSTGATPRRGKRCAPSRPGRRIKPLCSSPASASKVWIKSPRPTATPNRPSSCKRPNENCFLVFDRNEKAREPTGAPWKCRAVEKEENQNQVSLLSPRPWKSPARFPHSHRADSCLSFQNEPKTNERSPPAHPSLTLTLQAHSQTRKCLLGANLSRWRNRQPTMAFIVKIWRPNC